MRIAFIGGGSHLHSIYDSLDKEKYEVVGCLDNLLEGETKEGIKVLGGLFEFAKLACDAVFISLGDLELRRKVIDALGDTYPLITIIDPSAVIAESAVIEEGTFVGKNAVVNSYAHIGKNCIINTASVVEHNCVLDENVHMAPGALLCGGVQIGRDTMVGAHATIIQTLHIGANSTIGAGATIIRDVRDGVCVVGTPGKEIK